MRWPALGIVGRRRDGRAARRMRARHPHVRGGAFGCVRPLFRTAPRHRDTSPNRWHGTPLGLAAAKSLVGASSVCAFRDHSPIVATFEG